MGMDEIRGAYATTQWRVDFVQNLRYGLVS